MKSHLWGWGWGWSTHGDKLARWQTWIIGEGAATLPELVLQKNKLHIVVYSLKYENMTKGKTSKFTCWSCLDFARKILTSPPPPVFCLEQLTHYEQLFVKDYAFQKRLILTYILYGLSMMYFSSQIHWYLISRPPALIWTKIKHSSFLFRFCRCLNDWWVMREQ